MATKKKRLITDSDEEINSNSGPSTHELKISVHTPFLADESQTNSKELTSSEDIKETKKKSTLKAPHRKEDNEDEVLFLFSFMSVNVKM
jgi:hypothetical protein